MLTHLIAFACLSALAFSSPINPTHTISQRYTNVYIYSQRSGLCISVEGGPNGRYSEGARVVSLPCGASSTWNINPGSGSVISYQNPGFALDAGSTPGNNGALKIWSSYSGLYQQTWYLTGDNRIAITGGNQCLDEGNNGIQTYQCTPGNGNQVFFTRSAGNPPPTPSQSGTYPPPGTVYPDKNGPSGGRRIHPLNRPDLCATVMGGTPPTSGAAIQITYCFGDNDPNVNSQLWDISVGRQSTFVPLHSNTNLCLTTEAGNGGRVSLVTCGSARVYQIWTFVQNQIFAVNTPSCLDIARDSRGYQATPYSAVQNLQTWECSTGNPQQGFALLAA